MSAKNVWQGLLGVYKPVRMRSAETVSTIKHLILAHQKANLPTASYSKLRVGHGGTLDCTAEGVLVIGVGRATKALSAFLHCDKKYSVQGFLGIATTTYDLSGSVTGQKPFGHITRAMLEDALKEKFSGKIMQRPPPYSALKIQGQRYSDLNSQGIAATPPERPVVIHDIKCTEFQPPFFSLDVHCGGGTYIRSIVHDLAAELGSLAHVHKLVRTKQGDFDVSTALTTDQWTAENIHEALVASTPKWRAALEVLGVPFETEPEGSNVHSQKLRASSCASSAGCSLESTDEKVSVAACKSSECESEVSAGKKETKVQMRRKKPALEQRNSHENSQVDLANKTSSSVMPKRRSSVPREELAEKSTGRGHRSPDLTAAEPSKERVSQCAARSATKRELKAESNPVDEEGFSVEATLQEEHSVDIGDVERETRMNARNSHEERKISNERGRTQKMVRPIRLKISDEKRALLTKSVLWTEPHLLEKRF